MYSLETLVSSIWSVVCETNGNGKTGNEYMRFRWMGISKSRMGKVLSRVNAPGFTI